MSSAETAWTRANELAVLYEDYDQASALYNEAVKSEPSVAKYYLGRASNNLKLKNYLDVITDTEKFLELSPGDQFAWFRKGSAYFALNEFESALAAFQQAEALGAKNSALWIRKCQAELRREGQTEEVVDVKTPAVADAQKKAEKSKPAPKTESKPKESKPKEEAKKQPAAEQEPVAEAKQETKQEAEALKAPEFQGLAAKVKDNWTQNSSAIQITLFAKNLTEQNVKVELSGQQLSAVLTMPDQSVWQKTWNLYAPLKEGGLKVKVNAFKVEVSLDKQSPGEWKALEGAPPSSVVQRENTVSGSGQVPPPYSSKKDWNEVEQSVKKAEAEEKPEGQDALQKLFQQIYGDGDPEVKRAMMKSYQTSGGTVLSTNWKEVREKDYEKEGITPPAGQEVRKWTDN